VRRWEETDDVLQNALLRLHRALREVALPSARDFFRLAALQIRRELLDLARHHYGPHGLGAHHASRAAAHAADGSQPPAHEPAAHSHEPGRLAAWTEFHTQAGALPDDEREVFDLLWYQGLSQAEAATILGISERTVKRRWQAARLALHQALHGELPE
jgi:RNA polymerase sigma-70 factor (ECF subfamily)